MTSTSDLNGASTRLPLLCDLGLHRPDATPRWNNGYYFTTCTRCGHDLVRTAFGKWHVPRGYRIVWQASPPAGTVSAKLTKPGGTPVATDDLEQRIVREVIRQLRDGDLTGETRASVEEAVEEPPSPPDPAPVEPLTDVTPENAEPAAARRSTIPDFMDDGWPSPPPSMAHRQAVHHDETVPSSESMAPNALDMLRGWRDNARRMVASSSENGGTTGSGRWQVAIVIVLFLIIVASAATALLQRDQAGTSNRMPTEAVAAAPSVVPPSPTLPAFVTASTLNCRATPARDGTVVARLSRGMAVEAIARDGEWVSLSLADGQCWALGRYISADRPI